MALATKKIPFHEQLVIAMDGRTNRALAEKTGIHESEISRIVSGRLNPTQAQINKIIAALPDYTFDLV
jgi:predicted transcriptional regulator